MFLKYDRYKTNVMPSAYSFSSILFTSLLDHKFDLLLVYLLYQLGETLILMDQVLDSLVEHLEAETCLLHELKVHISCCANLILSFEEILSLVIYSGPENYKLFSFLRFEIVD